MPLFDEVDELLFQLEEERPVDVAESPMEDPQIELDEDDVESILMDTYSFLEQVLDVSRTQWQATGCRVLLARIEGMLAWHKLQ